MYYIKNLDNVTLGTFDELEKALPFAFEKQDNGTDIFIVDDENGTIEDCPVYELEICSWQGIVEDIKKKGFTNSANLLEDNFYFRKYEWAHDYILEEIASLRDDIESDKKDDIDTTEDEKRLSELEDVFANMESDCLYWIWAWDEKRENENDNYIPIHDYKEIVTYLLKVDRYMA